jgi:hypothetical protein
MLSHLEIGFIVAIIVAVAVLIGLFAIPVSHPFHDQLVGTGLFGTEGTATINPPVGSYVSGTWSVLSGSPEGIIILDSYNETVYDGIFSNSFGFTANHPPYVLGIVGAGTINVWGNISYPIL